MESRAPYRAAVVVSLIVLAGYFVTLAPTVTFWDAGEFITAAKTLGIPHPPGTPLFVMLTHAWATLIPFGAYAWRTNLLSAVCSAAAAGFWFLVVHDIVARLHPDIDARSRATFSMLGGIAAALLIGFSYTTWQGATETEVYATTMVGTAVIAWLATRWRIHRASALGSRLILLSLYICALSVGNHLMGLLVGPALIAMLVMEARTTPLTTRADQDSEWARIGVVIASWLLLVGVGLGNSVIAAIGVCLVVAACIRAIRAGQLKFAVGTLVVLAAGVSTLLFLYLRSRQQPWLNSGNPSNWRDLLGVVRRSQYPVRTPFDDPTMAHGAGNSGRTLPLLGYQLANYIQYFDWQWAAGIGDLARASLARLSVTLLMLAVGIRGAFAHRRADRPSFSLIAMLFLFGGPLLVLYLNFKPGPSIGWDRWLNAIDHEVRDRDYFFVGSFIAWAVWVAIGVVDLARVWIPRVAGARRMAVSAIFAVALIPVVLNFRAATRQQTPGATLARDFARALLESVPQRAVLFTNGDNDTFPLWYVQQVEGMRQDVTVVCLCLAQAPWYINDLRLHHGVIFDPIDSLRAFRTSEDLALPIGTTVPLHIRSGTIISPADVLLVEVLRASGGRRPIAWIAGTTEAPFDLGPQLVQQGMALILPTLAELRSDTPFVAMPASSVRFNFAVTRQLIENRWWFGRLEVGGYAELDPNIQVVARTIAGPMTLAGAELATRGDTAGAVRILRRAVRLADDSLARATLRRLGTSTPNR